MEQITTIPSPQPVQMDIKYSLTFNNINEIEKNLEFTIDYHKTIDSNDTNILKLIQIHLSRDIEQLNIVDNMYQNLLTKEIIIIVPLELLLL